MDTKLKGDIAEQAVVIHALKRGWEVLRPVGDRLPYDLVFDVGGNLSKSKVQNLSLKARYGDLTLLFILNTEF
ncbi:group I intron-associated PD-(D/E)XK endonuclease [Nostoc piscinale]|uniref:group I intron-associated PD-(D/E)XK endonuclease n=1 Tax=Nostoc piscinale TaxID=224012 RepID=UPI0039A5840B